MKYFELTINITNDLIKQIDLWDYRYRSKFTSIPFTNYGNTNKNTKNPEHINDYIHDISDG